MEAAPTKKCSFDLSGVSTSYFNETKNPTHFEDQVFKFYSWRDKYQFLARIFVHLTKVLSFSYNFSNEIFTSRERASKGSRNWVGVELGMKYVRLAMWPSYCDFTLYDQEGMLPCTWIRD